MTPTEEARLASLDEVTAAIRSIQGAQERVVVGVDGFGGAGKSTLAVALAAMPAASRPANA